MSLPADVREPNEVALGSIPSSVNLPLSTFEKNLSMDEGAFLLAFSGIRDGSSSRVVESPVSCVELIASTSD